MLSDVHMPDMDGFKLLEHIALELDVPVMMMSANCATDVVLRGIIHGAVDYLLKPVRIEELRNIWQHVVRKKREETGGEKDGASAGSGDAVSEGSEGSRGGLRGKLNGTSKLGDKGGRKAGGTTSSDEPVKKRSKKSGLAAVTSNENDAGNRSAGKDSLPDTDEGHEDSSALKKPRVVWSAELHQQFVTAVNTLGIDKAVPKRILDLMGVQGLTRENVASHLQKYRLYLKRLQGVNNGAGGPGGGGSPGFMTGLAVDPNGVVLGGPGARVGSPALTGMGGGPGGMVVNGMDPNGMNGMHHLQNGLVQNGMMYQMAPGPNGMIPIPGVHSGPGGDINVKMDKNGSQGDMLQQQPYPTMGPPMMMPIGGGNGAMHPGGMHPNGMHHVNSAGQMHGGMLMGLPQGQYPGQFQNGNGGVMMMPNGGMMMPGPGGVGDDLSFDKKGANGGIGDLGDDAVLDMFLKDGLPEGDGF